MLGDVYLSGVCIMAHNLIYRDTVACPTDSTCEQEEKATKVEGMRLETSALRNVVSCRYNGGKIMPCNRFGC